MANLNKPTERKRAKAPKIRLPAVVGYPAVFPLPIDGMLCPWCHSRSVGEPHSFAELFGGALRRTDENSYKSADDLSGFLGVGWHGAHPQEGGIGPDPHIGLSIELAATADAGQFEFYFCSTQCLRAFLNFCVDELEGAVRKEKRKKGRKVKTRARST